MIRNTIFFVGLSLLIIVLFACRNETNKKTDKALESIPLNSTVITAFDLPTLMEKANFEAVKKMDFYDFFAQRAREESDLLGTVMTNPENAGIDLSKNAYLTIELDNDNPEEYYIGVIFNLTSAEDFGNFAKSFRNSLEGKGNGYQTTNLNDATQLAWNDQIGIIVVGENIYEKEDLLEQFFVTKKEDNFSKNEKLTKLLSEKHDVTTWLTSNPLAKNKNAKFLLSLAKIQPDALNDNFVHGFVDFNKGQINAKLNYFFQDALVEDFRLLFKDNIKTDFSKLYFWSKFK